MPKHFFDPQAQDGHTVTFEGDTAHHMLHVLRLAPGDTAVLCDGCGQDYPATLAQSHAKQRRAVFHLSGPPIPCRTEPPAAVTLYQALPKGDKMDSIVQKAVELGVTGIVPMYTFHSVPQATRKGEGKQVRWQRIATAAAAQCMRGVVPTVAVPQPFDQGLAHAAAHPASIPTQMPAPPLWLIADETADTHTIRDVLAPLAPQPVALWVGPEGGFSAEERAALREGGGHSITLGPRILRTETAGLVALSHIWATWEVPK